MLTIAWYLLKVTICSGILLGYYWLALRNKIFHHYNRFYLLLTIILSMLLPFIEINFWQNTSVQSSTIKVIEAVSYGNTYVNDLVISAAPLKKSFNWQILYPIIYFLISMLLSIGFIKMLFEIRKLLKKYPAQKIDYVTLVNTNNERGTPFSFLKYIFWNSAIDTSTTQGNQIFEHELAHIKEKHTYDKLFINIVLIIFWFNPFFWLLRKEINLIHEFIADKKAVKDGDISGFAAMLLQTIYPQHQFSIANNFFYSPIKRRLLMLTKNKNPRVNYFGRILVLPLFVLIFAAFTFKIKDEATLKNSEAVTKGITLNFQTTTQRKSILNIDTPHFGMFMNTNHADTNYFKTAAFKNKALVIIDGKEIGNFGFVYVEKNSANFNSSVFYNAEKAKKIYGVKGKYGVIKLTIKDAAFTTAKSVFFDEQNNLIKFSGTSNIIKGDLSKVLIYIDGKISSPADLNKISPDKINDIAILRGDKLDDIIDAKGKTALINVSLKADDLPEVIITSKIKKPLYIINGKESTKEEFDKLAKERITDIREINESIALQVYGDKGKNGAIIINCTPETSGPYADKMIAIGDISKLGANPFVEVDNKEYTGNSLPLFMKESGIEHFELITIYAKEDAIKKFGNKASDGAIITTTKKIKSTAEHKVAIALDKMNMLYIDVDNPVSLAVSGYNPEDLIVSMHNGTITGKDGKYIARVSNTNPAEIIIEIIESGKKKYWENKHTG